MVMVKLEERVLSKLVDQYLDSRRSTDWPVSISGAMRAVRAAPCSTRLSDAELVALIAQAAVAKGRNVAFDFQAGSPETED
jgi:hypothetical protein